MIRIDLLVPLGAGNVPKGTDIETIRTILMKLKCDRWLCRNVSRACVVFAPPGVAAP